MDEPKEPPQVNFSEENLDRAGFTDSGKPGFKRTVSDYSTMLFNKAVRLADVHKAEDCPREVTHEHVKEAAVMIAKSYAKPPVSKWFTLMHVLEYICTLIFGFGLAKLDQSWALPVILFAAVIGVILFTVRLIKTNPD